MSKEQNTEEHSGQTDNADQRHFVRLSGENRKNDTYLEIYRITMEFISKLLLPGVLVFVILIFRPTINALLSKTTEAEIAGNKFKFAQKIEAAVKSGDSKEAEETFLKFRSKTSEDVILKFWMPDGQNINQDNQARIRKWMEDNGGGQSIPFFINAEMYAKEREKAIKDLDLRN